MEAYFLRRISARPGSRGAVMKALDKMDWEILNATADDCENLEEIFLNLAFEPGAKASEETEMPSAPTADRENQSCCSTWPTAFAGLLIKDFLRRRGTKKAGPSRTPAISATFGEGGFP